MNMICDFCENKKVSEFEGKNYCQQCTQSIFDEINAKIKLIKDKEQGIQQ
jgi:hypothetical protein